MNAGLPHAGYRVVDERRRHFAELRDSNVLIYWPHGLGDWVHLSGILPLFEPSNRYFITRFGDDYVSLFDGNTYVRTIHSEINHVCDGAEFGARHFGLDFRKISGGVRDVALPGPFYSAFASARIDTILYTDYPDTKGEQAFPFHTKARKLARNLVAAQRLAQFDLAQPLKSTIDFSVDPTTQRIVDDRLARLMAPGDKLCIVATAGHTAERKNWDPAQAERFNYLLAARDSRWKVLSLARDYAALLGDTGLSFAAAFKGLLARTDLLVGVPAGPFHMAMARNDIPVVGIWLAHHPDWFDEPNPLARHLIGRYVSDRGYSRRKASTTKPPSLRHQMQTLDTQDVPAEAVIACSSLWS